MGDKQSKAPRAEEPHRAKYPNEEIKQNSFNNEINKNLMPSISNRPVLSESASKFQHYLKFLYKNNFVSLTYEDLCVFIIQYHWRRYFIEEIRKKKRGIIDVIYTSLTTNQLAEAKTTKTFLILDGRKYPYRCFDLTVYQKLSKFIEELGGVSILPAIFINGYYIGSYENLQEFEDSNIISKLLIGEYEDSCLVCHITKTNLDLDTCPFCYKKYKYFAKKDHKYDIWEMRK